MMKAYERGQQVADPNYKLTYQWNGIRFAMLVRAFTEHGAKAQAPKGATHIKAAPARI